MLVVAVEQVATVQEQVFRLLLALLIRLQSVVAVQDLQQHPEVFLALTRCLVLSLLMAVVVVEAEMDQKQ
jgi:hypothetical protein